MTSFLHRRPLLFLLLLWSAYVATWTVLTSSGPASVTLWWLVGTIVFGLLSRVGPARVVTHRPTHAVRELRPDAE